jgi:hypothetical protein
MKWIFITTNLLTELDTGFSIRLISGTWSSPIEIRPDKTTVNIDDQARLLRLGLEYAKSRDRVIRRLK